MSLIATKITSLASTLLKFSPTATIHSWLLYLGIQTHVRATIDPSLKPLHNICEYLNALHIYADEAREHGTAHRAVESFHFCSHARKDFRQCLVYDSNEPGARLLGVEYMIPRERFLKLPEEERRLWHSHEFEVKSGMLVLPRPESHATSSGERIWEGLETEAMREVVGWYGKTFHMWQVDVDDEIPMGMPRLMGSLTGNEQLDINEELKDRNRRFGVDHRQKAELRKDIEVPGVADGADSWWTEAKQSKVGVYSS